MTPFWVDVGSPLRLAIVPRPRGGDWLEAELLSIKRAGVDVLISMLTPSEQAELYLVDESNICKQIDLEYLSFPIMDRSVPENTAEFRVFVDNLQGLVSQGKSIATHCRTSIGRSSVVLAALMCKHGWKVDEAFSRISAARGLRVPDTEEQTAWIASFATSLSNTGSSRSDSSEDDDA